MKRICTLCLLVVAVFTIRTASAQCIPDTNITHNVNGIYPDSATGLPHAIVGVPYSTVIQMKVVRDTTYNGLPAVINTFTITGVTGLPAGWSYTCTPSSCVFPGGSDACILLVGPAPTVSQVGVYPFVVNLSVAGSVFGIPQTVPAAITQYTIYIDNPTGIGTPLPPSQFTVSEFSPNPMQFESRIRVGVMEPGDVRLELVDMLGNLVRQSTYQAQRGWNSYSVDVSDLRPGIYLAHLRSGKDHLVRRMIVNGR
ncbi:MAG: T9SS type A sorting domain-containing protein [Bacteroidota bacterium]